MWWKKDAPANQRGRSWAEKGNSSEGEHGEIKAALQSWSLVDLFEGWWLSAGMRTNTDVGDMWRGDLSTCTNTPQNTPSEAATNGCHSLFKLRWRSPHSSASSPAVLGTKFRLLYWGSWQKVSSLCGLQPWLSPAEDRVCLKTNYRNLTYLNTNNFPSCHWQAPRCERAIKVTSPVAGCSQYGQMMYRNLHFYVLFFFFSRWHVEVHHSGKAALPLIPQRIVLHFMDPRHLCDDVTSASVVHELTRKACGVRI